MATLHIAAQKMNIELDKGATFDPIFWVLDSNNAVIDLTSFGAVMQFKEDYSDVVPLFDLTVANGLITIVTTATLTIEAGTVINGVELSTDLTVSNAYGVQPLLTATETSSITQDCLVYALDLIDADSKTRPYLKGKVKLNADGTT